MFKEQREDELMLRQNSTERAFESDDNDSKSDAAAELNFDSDEASEHVRIKHLSDILLSYGICSIHLKDVHIKNLLHTL